MAPTVWCARRADLSDLAESPDAETRAQRSRADYQQRVNRVVDAVLRDPAASLRLEELARVACFSPFHFHRVFQAVMGETLHDFVRRVRLERAVHFMATRQKARLTDVALACGFASSSDFSKAFRARYGVPPRRFDVEAHRAAHRPALSALARPAPDARFDVVLRQLPARRVAYLRVKDPYQGPGVLQACQRLVAWAQARGLEGGQWLGAQWEDPELVPLSQCRYDVAVEVPPTAVLDGEVSVAWFQPMRVAEVSIDGGLDLEVAALEHLYRVFLPSSGLVPDHQPCFEAWEGLPFADGMTRFRLRAQLPVVDADTAL
jgi:AraC family transcriptional regulator